MVERGEWQPVLCFTAGKYCSSGSEEAAAPSPRYQKQHASFLFIILLLSNSRVPLINVG